MKIILLILYFLLLLSVIFFERKNPSEAMVWVLILLFLPYLGAFIYLIFGSTLSIKITRELRNAKLIQRYEGKFNYSKNFVYEDINDFDFSDIQKQVINFNKAYNDSELTCYDDYQIFTDGKSHYTKLFSDLKNAKNTIHIQYYTIHNDQVGNEFMKILTQKASEGLEVIVMCDFIANVSSPKKMFRPFVEAGGRFKRVKPFLTHFRSHRKLVVIDNQVAYIGGMNIGKQYANMAEIKNPWRDTQIRLTGQCCGLLEVSYMADWFCNVKKAHLEDAEKSADKAFSYKYPVSKHPCQFVVGGVDTDKESIKMCYLSMIRSAKSHIRIQSPYFIPDESTIDALKTAAASGVEIEIIIPGIKASFFLDPVTNYYCGQLMQYGAKVYKYKGYIHAKTIVIDNKICCIGSVNLDIRSLLVDDEICGVFYDKKLVNEYIDIFNNDIENTKKYTLQDFKTRSNKEKIRENFFLLFSPIL